MKTYYNLYKYGRFLSRTKSLSVAQQLEALGWSYQTVKVKEANNVQAV